MPCGNLKNNIHKTIYMQTIEKFNFAGQKVFVRVDFNVPLDEKLHITDDTRIRAAIPTLKKILADGGSAIISSHLGRPKGVEDKYSLRHILPRISELLGVEVAFAGDCLGQEAAEKAAALKPGQALVLENLRFYAAEEGKPRGLADDASEEEKAAAKKKEKANQKEMAKQLASYATVYVNDAFGTAHRAHASTALIADHFDADHKLFGYLMQNEIDAVERVLKNTVRPFTAIMGGSKVSSKIEIIENLLTKVDNLIIAGGMTYTFTKALGGNIGHSIVENDKLDLALNLIQRAKENNVNLVLAEDAKAADSFSNDAKTQIVPVDRIPDGWEGLDIGPASEKKFAEVIEASKTILWNGPTGVFEFENFTSGSAAVGAAIVRATGKGAYSLVGGGDSVACVNKFGIADKMSYVSTGGGALLEFIEGKELPGIKAIRGY
jgi:phosphoglycerate kinase